MAFNFEAKQAVREKIFTKIALMSPSGGGKSYSALRLATGMKKEIEKNTGKKAKILVGNTEGSRGRYYADEFEYDIVDLNPPFEPEMFVAFIEYAIKSGYDILVLDSTSPEWEGKGGCLELHAQAGGKYQDWAKVTPRHDKFIYTIADSPIHIIATMRGKDQYELDKDERGKTNVKKLGVGAKQRDGFEYEFTSTFLIDVKSHTAEPQKDNTHIFDNEANVKLTEEHGEKIIQWANSGDGYTIYARRESGASVNSEVAEVINNIDALIKELQDCNVDRTEIVKVVKEQFSVNGKPSANFKMITDINIANNVLNALTKLKK